MDFKSILRGEFVEKDEAFYFIKVPEDVEPSRHKNSRDKTSWSPWRKENYEFFKRELEALPKETLLLDIGAGELQFFDILERFNFIGIDFYPYPGIRVVCDLNQALPFADGSADVLLLSNVLEHVAEPNALLAECRRVLKPGGVILGAVPFMINIHQRPYDFYRYTDMNLRHLLEKHGFREVAVQPVMLPSALMLAVASSFFIQLIEHSTFAKNRLFQRIYVFCFRVLWKFVRTAFRVLDPILKKCKGDENLPLGYHFKAKKPDRN